MISVLKQGKDAEGREFVEIAMNAVVFQAAAVSMPVVGLGLVYMQAGQGPQGMPWFMIAGPVVGGIAALAALTWLCARSVLRVTVDRRAGTLVAKSGGGQAEYRIADVARAEFGIETNARGQPVGRLEFVMRDGAREPAPQVYFGGYAERDRAAMVAAINAKLGSRMV